MSDYSFSSAINAMGGMSQGYEQMKRRKQDERMAAIANIIDAMKTYGGRQERLGREKRGYQHDIGMTRLGTDEALRQYREGTPDVLARMRGENQLSREHSEAMIPIDRKRAEMQAQVREAYPDRPGYVEDMRRGGATDSDAWDMYHKWEIRKAAAYAQMQKDIDKEPPEYPNGSEIFIAFKEGYLPLSSLYQSFLTEGRPDPEKIRPFMASLMPSYDWAKASGTDLLKWFNWWVNIEYQDSYYDNINDVLSRAWTDDPALAEEIARQARARFVQEFPEEQPPPPGGNVVGASQARSGGWEPTPEYLEKVRGQESLLSRFMFGKPAPEQEPQKLGDMLYQMETGRKRDKDVAKEARDVMANPTSVKEWEDFLSKYRRHVPRTQITGGRRDILSASEYAKSPDPLEEVRKLIQKIYENLFPVK
jgi:hypothetical protein